MKTNICFSYHTSSKMSETQEDCVICMEKLGGDMRTLPCNHKFHTHCYAMWSARSRTNTTSCPCCRAEHEDPIRVSSNPRRRRRHNVRYYDHFEPPRPSFMEPPVGFNNNSLANQITEEIIRNRLLGHNREPTIQEAIALMIILFFVVAIAAIGLTVHKTCICNVSWDPGEIRRTETYFFGGETTFERPEICTWVC